MSYRKEAISHNPHNEAQISLREDSQWGKNYLNNRPRKRQQNVRQVSFWEAEKFFTAKGKR